MRQSTSEKQMDEFNIFHPKNTWYTQVTCYADI